MIGFGTTIILIYINDMTNISNKVKIIFFADDKNLILDNTLDLEHIMQENFCIIYIYIYYMNGYV